MVRTDIRRDGETAVGKMAIHYLLLLLSLGINTVTISLLMKMREVDNGMRFRAAIAIEKKNGNLGSPNGMKNLVFLTEVAIAAAPRLSMPASRQDLDNVIKTVFHSGTGAAAKVYRILLDGKVHTLDELARKCDYDPTNKNRIDAFKVILDILDSKDIMIMVSKNSYRISDMSLYKMA